MAMNRIQFQAGLTLPRFIELYGTEEKCEAALEPPLPGKLTPVHPDHFHHQGA
jgi:hypothetical protein